MQFTWKCEVLVCTHVRVCAFYTLCTSLSFLPQGQGVQQYTLGTPLSLEVDIYLLTLMGQLCLGTDLMSMLQTGLVRPLLPCLPHLYGQLLWNRQPKQTASSLSCFNTETEKKLIDRPSVPLLFTLLPPPRHPKKGSHSIAQV